MLVFISILFFVLVLVNIALFKYVFNLSKLKLQIICLIVSFLLLSPCLFAQTKQPPTFPKEKKESANKKQCQAITQKGFQCKRKTTAIYCAQHEAISKKQSNN